MSYSESELDFNFAINFKYESETEFKSESESSSEFMNLDICIFFTVYLHSTLLNKLADNFFFIHSHNRINSYGSNASIVHIFF